MLKVTIPEKNRRRVRVLDALSILLLATALVPAIVVFPEWREVRAAAAPEADVLRDKFGIIVFMWVLAAIAFALGSYLKAYGMGFNLPVRIPEKNTTAFRGLVVEMMSALVLIICAMFATVNFGFAYECEDAALFVSAGLTATLVVVCIVYTKRIYKLQNKTRGARR